MSGSLCTAPSAVNELAWPTADWKRPSHGCSVWRMPEAGYRFAAKLAGSTQGRKQTSTAWHAPMSSSRTGRSSAKAAPSRRMSSLRTSGLPRWHSTRANGRPRSASTPPVCGLFQAASTRTPTSKNPTHACSKDSRPAARPRPPVGSPQSSRCLRRIRRRSPRNCCGRSSASSNKTPSSTWRCGAA